MDTLEKQYINAFSTPGRFFLIIVIWVVLDSQNLSPGSTSVISSQAVGLRKARKPWPDALWNKVGCWVKAESVLWYICFFRGTGTSSHWAMLTPGSQCTWFIWGESNRRTWRFWSYDRVWEAERIRGSYFTHCLHNWNAKFLSILLFYSVKPEKGFGSTGDKGQTVGCNKEDFRLWVQISHAPIPAKSI